MEYLKSNLLIVILSLVIIVLIGSNVYSYVERNNGSINASKDNPLSNLTNLFEPKEKPSPYDRIKESQIHVYSDKIVIDIENPEWATFSDTNSMDPVIDYGANAVEITPQSEEDIHVGDVVSYESEYADGVIIHRVVKMGNDEKGTYYIMQGDNNPEPDPGRVRFNQIKRVLVAVIY